MLDASITPFHPRQPTSIPTAQCTAGALLALDPEFFTTEVACSVADIWNTHTFKTTYPHTVLTDLDALKERITMLDPGLMIITLSKGRSGSCKSVSKVIVIQEHIFAPPTHSPITIQLKAFARLTDPRLADSAEVRREIQASMAISSPHVMSPPQCVTNNEGQMIGYFTDYAPYDLHDILEHVIALPQSHVTLPCVDMLLKLFLQIIRGVHDMHNEGIIHCDIKPSNILIHKIGAFLVAKVIDMASARWISSLKENYETGEEIRTQIQDCYSYDPTFRHLFDTLKRETGKEKMPTQEAYKAAGGTQESTLAMFSLYEECMAKNEPLHGGTPEYKAPEVRWDRKWSLQADIYSLAVIFNWMLRINPYILPQLKAVKIDSIINSIYKKMHAFRLDERLDDLRSVIVAIAVARHRIKKSNPS